MTTKNPMLVPTVPLELDHQRLLAYDLNAFSEIEDVYDTTEAALDAVQNGHMKAVRLVLWAGLLWDAQQHDEDLTLHQVGAMVSFSNMKPVADAIMAALIPSLAEKKAASEAEAEDGDLGETMPAPAAG